MNLYLSQEYLCKSELAWTPLTIVMNVKLLYIGCWNIWTLLDPEGSTTRSERRSALVEMHCACVGLV